MNFFIDTHSHIYYDEYKHDLPDIISKAEEANIGRIICVGTDIETSYDSIKISNQASRRRYCNYKRSFNTFLNFVWI